MFDNNRFMPDKKTVKGFVFGFLSGAVAGFLTGKEVGKKQQVEDATSTEHTTETEE